MAPGAGRCDRPRRHFPAGRRLRRQGRSARCCSFLTRDAPWTALIPGAVLVGVGIQGLHLFTALYLVPRIGRSSELYGALGTATVILLWLYIIARLITLSAFLNATLWERHHEAA